MKKRATNVKYRSMQRTKRPKSDRWKLDQRSLVARIGGKYYRIRVPDGRQDETLGLKFLSEDFAENAIGLPVNELPETGFNRAIAYLTAAKRNTNQMS